EMAEAFADGEIDEEALREASAAAREMLKGLGGEQPAFYERARHDPATAYAWAAACVVRFDDEYTYGYGVCGGERGWGATGAEGGAAEAALVREVFGNPFRPVAFEPGWRSPDVLRLGRAIYEERAFDRLPILADALEEAGCDDAELLGHLRGDGPHARGCWAL